MTLLIHFLMCLTTMFERGVPADEPSSHDQLIYEDTAPNNPEKE